MRKKSLFTLLLISIVSGVIAQKSQTKLNAASQPRNNNFTSNKKGQALGVHVTFSDFTTPKTFKSSPTPIRQSEGVFLISRI